MNHEFITYTRENCETPITNCIFNNRCINCKMLHYITEKFKTCEEYIMYEALN